MEFLTSLTRLDTSYVRCHWSQVAQILVVHEDGRTRFQLVLCIFRHDLKLHEWLILCTTRALLVNKGKNVHIVPGRIAELPTNKRNRYGPGLLTPVPRWTLKKPFRKTTVVTVGSNHPQQGTLHFEPAVWIKSAAAHSGPIAVDTMQWFLQLFGRENRNSKNQTPSEAILDPEVSCNPWYYRWNIHYHYDVLLLGEISHMVLQNIKHPLPSQKKRNFHPLPRRGIWFPNPPNFWGSKLIDEFFQRTDIHWSATNIIQLRPRRSRLVRRFGEKLLAVLVRCPSTQADPVQPMVCVCWLQGMNQS